MSRPGAADFVPPEWEPLVTDESIGLEVLLEAGDPPTVTAIGERASPSSIWTGDGSGAGMRLSRWVSARWTHEIETTARLGGRHVKMWWATLDSNQ